MGCSLDGGCHVIIRKPDRVPLLVTPQGRDITTYIIQGD